MSFNPFQARQRNNLLRVVDRRTGAPLYVGGQALTVFARDAQTATRELMRHRDPRRWRVTVTPLGRVAE